MRQPVLLVTLSLFAIIALNIPSTYAVEREPTKPNIVLIYADDLGYGDVSCYGATEVSTPNVDRIAKEGVKFTDGHSPSATCTPSRYAMLTGEYAWRRKGTGIARGDAPMVIEPGRKTLATILNQAGYKTGVVGKWHLGLGDGNVDWNQSVSPGPETLGFDYHFLIPATGDRVPCVYIEQNRVVDLDPADPITVSFKGKVGNDPTGKENPELLKMKWHHGHNATIINGISRIGFMSGGNSARWIDEDMADVITNKATAFIDDNKDETFFLYFSYHDIHVPRVPHKRFVGKTKMGPRGDAIVQLDWCTGEILKKLDEHGLAENTLVIFSSDNGPVLNDGYYDDAVEKIGKHRPAGPFRGGKYSAFEAGTRVPFLVRWPAKVKPGTSDALVCQVDFLASLAALTGQKLNEKDAPDSHSVLPALLGKDQTGRDHLVEHANALSLRKGNWKYIERKKGAKKNSNVNIETGLGADGQLYDLSKDIGEKTNLVKKNPKKAEELATELNRIRQAGRSR